MAVIALACTINGAAWWGKVYPGFFLWENGFVPALGAIDAPAARAGLRYQSRLVGVDGTPIGARRDVEARVGAAPAGTSFTYTFEKAGERYDVTLASAPLDATTFWVTIANYLINAIALLALGIAIIFLEPQSRAARAFLVFCTNWGLYLATSVDLMGPSWFRDLYFFLVTLCPTTALHAAIEFPGVPLGVARLRAFLPALYATSVALGAASVVAFRHSFPVLMALDRITHLAIGAAGLGALAIIVIAFRRPATAAARQRLKILLLGLVAAFLAPAAVLLAVYTGEAAVPLNYLTVGFAIFPAAMAYGIARHDLFGVDRMIRRTVAYVAVTVVIGLVYTALLSYLDYVVMPDLSASPAVHVLVTMLLVALFNPLRGRIQALIDLLYFRKPYDYRTTVAVASQALASLLDLDELIARLVRIITDQMQIESAEVWLRDRDGATFRREGERAPTVSADSALVRHLAAHPRRAVHVAYGTMRGRIEAHTLDDMAAIGAILVVPLFFEQRVVGFLALGEKRSGRFYTTDDLELLETLANQAAVAVQNARAYRALAEANRDLREARDQLVEAERLAAIGELSAAVAHGIRNPLAGIKSSAELALQEAPPDDPLRESFADILTEADALEARIGELLDFARPFAPHWAPGDLNDLAGGVLRLLRRQIADRDVAVDLVLAPALPAHELDAAQIEQVCLALVTNALESMGAGGRLTLATAVLEDGAVLELRVRDTGHGIPTSELAKVFRLFYTRKARGTGVGLAIVKRIVESHHGRIEVTSTVGRGTEFRVLLPAHPETHGVAANGESIRRDTSPPAGESGDAAERESPAPPGRAAAGGYGISRRG